MPKLKAVLASADEIPDGFTDYYQEDTARGEFVLQLDGVDTHPTVRGLKSAYEKTKRSQETLKAKLDEFGEITPEEIEELRERAEAGGSGGGEGGTDEESVKRRVAEALEAQEKKFQRDRQKFESAMEESKGRETKLTTHLHRLHVENELTAAIGRLGIDEKVKPAVRARLREFGPKVVEDGDEYRGVFERDVAGIPGEHTIADFVTAWAETDEAQAFLPASGKGGSGAPPDGGRGGAGGRKGHMSRSDMTAWAANAEKIAKGEIVLTD